MPSAPPAIHNMEAPLFGRKHRGRKIDIETGDLIMEPAHHQEYWVVKRNLMGDIIDCYRVEADLDIRYSCLLSSSIISVLFSVIFYVRSPIFS